MPVANSISIITNASLAAEGQDIRQIGEKAAGIGALLRYGFPTPPTVILSISALPTTHSFAELQKATFLAIDELERIVGMPLGNELSGIPFLIAIRTDSKRSTSAIPPSIVNVGVPAGHPSMISKNHYCRCFRMRLCQIAPFLSLKQEDIYEIIQANPVQKVQILVTRYLIGLRLVKDLFKTVLIFQQMRFGNADGLSLSGMAYTRNPYTGEEGDYGRYIRNVPGFIYASSRTSEKRCLSMLRFDSPTIYSELRNTLNRLERIYDSPRYVEFVVENGELYLVQNMPPRNKQ